MHTPELAPRTLAPVGAPVPTPLDLNPVGLRILLALNVLGKPIYAGTVPPATKARRRAAGKAARIARRANRR